ncbi:MAG: hypothetical protein HYR84_04235 [Planctomycetes bacterium]|nr:hypothetical protein [Planctomycetota bacterium]
MNFNYPFPQEPLQTLSQLGINGLQTGLCGWETMKFVTFEHRSNPEEAARFIEDYVRGVFGIADIENEMRVEEQDL